VGVSLRVVQGGGWTRIDDREQGGIVRVASIPGDGIGQEVIPVAEEVMAAACERAGTSVEFQHFEWSAEKLGSSGVGLPVGWQSEIGVVDGILLGAIGHNSVADAVSLWELLLPIRRELNQYVNVRPIRSLRDGLGPLKKAVDVDMVIVRENVEGEYTEVGGSQYKGRADELVVQAGVFTRRGVERCIRFGFELARRRRGNLVSATKSNGLRYSMPFWDRVIAEVSDEYSDVAVRSMHVDALAARMIQAPEEFDVVVASNLFGDILSDLGAALVGGLGVAASANVNPTGQWPSMYEPVHGSAPDIAARGMANPMAAVMAGALLCEGIGLSKAARLMETAVRNVVVGGNNLPRDMGGKCTTKEVGEAIIAALA
jgi:tartrate dehydrogenase/decarboxylase/D-malate dehydrogenase